MDYEGKIYRPWPEANSLLIQATLGCTHNKCTFCDMFRQKRFRIRKIEEIFKDIDEARQIFPQVGLESGDRVTLERINKGMTPEQAKAGMAKARAAGFPGTVSEKD